MLTMGATRTGARVLTRPGAPTAGLGQRKTASFARFSRRFRGQSRPHGRIVQNGGKRFVTRASRVISVRSTGLAESCLTSQIGRDGVYSGSYERIMVTHNFTGLYTRPHGTLWPQNTPAWANFRLHQLAPGSPSRQQMLLGTNGPNRPLAGEWTSTAGDALAGRSRHHAPPMSRSPTQENLDCEMAAVMVK